MNYSLHHVHLICKDLETMINFFKKLLAPDLLNTENLELRKMR